MKSQSVAPTGLAQNFEVNETFFSTTDPKGIITAGNHVFSRTSGYELTELLGKPHNIIRHADMPRCVFRLLWETCKAGKSFVGYVKNQSRNGNHYWVLAVIVPIPTGYLSVRIKPTTPLCTQVEQAYAKLLVLENKLIAEEKTEAAATSAAALQLDQIIKSLGFNSYESFSHHCLNAEIESRDAEISGRRLRLFPEIYNNQDSNQILSTYFEQTRVTYERLNSLVKNLAPFAGMGAEIKKRKDVVQRIADDFRLHALNAHMAAHPLGAEGITIGTVAQVLSGHSQVLAKNVNALASNIGMTTAAVSSISSNISIARIQIEMLLSFIAEMGESTNVEGRPQLMTMARDLRVAFANTVGNTVRSINMLKAQMPEVQAGKEQLRQDIIYLHVAQISGLTEAARLRGADMLQTMFLDFKVQIEAAKTELEHLGSIVEQLIEMTNQTPPQVAAIYHSMDKLKEIMESSGDN